MVATMQGIVQRRYHALLMSLLGVGFIMLLIELIGYNHYRGAQIIGIATTVIGAIIAFLGISASGSRRRALAVAFLVLSLTGLLGTWFHNEDRIMGEDERRPPAGAQTTGDSQNAPTAQVQPNGQQNPQAQGGQPGAGRGARTPPPLLAPLSLSGFCLIGAVILLGRKDDSVD